MTQVQLTRHIEHNSGQTSCEFLSLVKILLRVYYYLEYLLGFYFKHSWKLLRLTVCVMFNVLIFRRQCSDFNLAWFGFTSFTSRNTSVLLIRFHDISDNLFIKWLKGFCVLEFYTEIYFKRKLTGEVGNATSIKIVNYHTGKPWKGTWRREWFLHKLVLYFIGLNKY